MPGGRELWSQREVMLWVWVSVLEGSKGDRNSQKKKKLLAREKMESLATDRKEKTLWVSCHCSAACPSSS